MLPATCSNGPGSVGPATTTTSSSDGYGCPWQTNSIWDAIHDERFDFFCFVFDF